MNHQIPLFKKPIIQHIIFWVLYFTFNVVRCGYYYDDFTYSFQSNLIEFPIHITLIYFTVYYLIPKYLSTKQFGLFSAILLSAIIVFSLGRILLINQLVIVEIWKVANTPKNDIFNLSNVVTVVVDELYVVAFVTSIKFALDWVKNLQSTKELENKRLEAELAFLRSQVQPHFFFNTLNDLYFLTLTKSDKATETVLKLSDLMSYVIYKGRHRQVSLLDEIAHIQNFIDLERLRLGKRLEFNFNISGNVEDKYIPPLILQPFVENSFKHGSVDESRILCIYINLEVKGNTLVYSVENQRFVTSKTVQPKMPEQMGIGIVNIKRRLHLLFKNNYSLVIKKKKKKYKIKLKIPLYDKMPDS